MGIEAKKPIQAPQIYFDHKSGFDGTHTKFVNFVLVFWATCMLVAVPLSVSRAQFTGWLPLYNLHIFLGAAILLVALLRNRVTLKIKKAFICIWLLVIGTGGLFTYGLVAAGFSLLMFSNITVAVLYQRRTFLVTSGFSLLILLVAAWGFVSGEFRLPASIETYSASPYAWALLIVANTPLVIGLFYAFNTYNSEYQRLIAHLRAIVEAEPECVKLLAADGALLDMNQAGLGMIDADSLSQAIGLPMQELVKPEYREAFIALNKRVFEGGSGILEFEIRSLKGTDRWLETHAVPMRDAKGHITCLLGITRDITKRKQIEDALRLSQFALDHTQDGVFWVNTESGIFEVNEQACRNLGYSRDELLGMRVWDFDPDFSPEAMQPFFVRLRSEGFIAFETCHKRKDGSVFPVGISSTYVSDGNKEYSFCIVRDISERKKAEKSLKESEEKFRRLFEDSADPILLLKNGRFIDCNTATLKLLGYSSKEAFINSSPSGISPPYQPDGRLSSEKSAEMDATALREGYHRFEWMHLRLDGSEIPVEVTLTMITVDEEQMLHVLWRDITERKQTEDRLRTRSLAVEQSPNSIVITDIDANIEYVNQTFVNETGYGLDEVIGKNPRLLHSDKNAKSIYSNMWDTLLRGGVWKGELVNRRKDGSEYIESMLISPVFQPDGKGSHYVAVKENITERKLNESQIERLSRLYQLLSRVNEAIVRAANRDALFAAICDAAGASGLFRFVWIGMLDEERKLVTPVAYAGIEEGYTKALHIRLDDERSSKGPTGTAIRENTHRICQNIATDPNMAPWREAALARGYRASCVMPIHESGIVVGAFNAYASEENFFTPDIIRVMLELAADMSFSLDVFAEKERREHAELEIRQMNLELEHRVAERTRLLEAANKELEAFSYSVSHDLRAPLRHIDGFSQILLKTYGEKFDAQGRDYLDRVRHSSQRMGELIEDMLYLSRVTHSEIRKEPVDLSLIARQIIESLTESAPDRQVDFNIEEAIRVNADAKLMRIVLENLLGNAWKFTSKKPHARIDLGITEQSGTRAIFVRDNGAGFNMDYANKLFSPFQRLHGIKEFEGTGIGLATVQRIIQRHGGQIWVEATEGQGATFFFTVEEITGKAA